MNVLYSYYSNTYVIMQKYLILWTIIFLLNHYYKYIYNFQPLTLNKVDKKISYCIISKIIKKPHKHCKRVFQLATIPANSNHTFTHKMTVYRHLINRILIHTRNIKEINKETQIKHQLHNNGYNNKTIHKHEKIKNTKVKEENINVNNN